MNAIVAIFRKKTAVVVVEESGVPYGFLIRGR